MNHVESNRLYQICTRCVMDTTDPDIVFDEQGVCNHCHAYDKNAANLLTAEAGRKAMQDMVAIVKRDNRRRPYDCIIGLSGGVDSSYVAYLAKQLGLRILAVHLDNGWDSELAVKNIENICHKLKIDLHTIVLDWEEFKDLQIAFLKASTPDSEIPSDHAIVSAMLQTAEKAGVNCVITGWNTRTETHIPKAWSQGYFDLKYIKSIHNMYGTRKLKTYPAMGLWKYYRYKRKIRMVNILDYYDYSKTEAMAFLEENLGWRYYGGKHYESIYTRFYQGYILPQKFGFDKRRAHCSSLVCSGEITREQAISELAKETYPQATKLEDRTYVIKKLGFTEVEFNKIMDMPKKEFWDYPSYGKIYGNRFYRAARTLYGRCFE